MVDDPGVRTALHIGLPGLLAFVDCGVPVVTASHGPGFGGELPVNLNRPLCLLGSVLCESVNRRILKP